MVQREGHKEPSVAELSKLTARRAEQVLHLSQDKDGAVKLVLFDGATEKGYRGESPCADCGAAELATSLQTNLGAVVGHCFDEDCRRVTYEPVPAEACEPLPEVAECKAGAASPSSGILGRGESSTAAKVAKGGVWGLFAATAATSIALFAANETAAGTGGTPSGGTVINRLTAPAWTAAGISLGTLGVAIPVLPVTAYPASALRPGQLKARLVQAQDAQGEEVQVAVAVGLALEDLDLVVQTLQRPRRDAVFVIGDDARPGAQQRRGQAVQRGQTLLGRQAEGLHEPGKQEDLGRLLVLLAPQLPQLLLRLLFQNQASGNGLELINQQWRQWRGAFSRLEHQDRRHHIEPERLRRCIAGQSGWLLLAAHASAAED